jgi:hypothetical protein
MNNQYKYFQDRVVLLLLSLDVIISLLASLIISLKLSNLPSNYYPITQGRFPDYLKIYNHGSVASLYSIVIFILLMLFINIFLSYKTYTHKRDYSLVILSFGILLVVLAYLVSQTLISFS